MFHNLYNQFKNQILRQELQGTFKSNSIDKTHVYLIVIGLVNIILGVVSFLSFYNTATAKINYSSDTIRKVYFKKGIYNMYIEIHGFYQNTLQYTKSINYDQLAGKTMDINLKDCKPYDYLNNKPYYPAGMISNTYFQDIIKIEGVKINSTDISWENQRKHIKITNYDKPEIVRLNNWTSKTNEGQVPLNTTPGSGLPILDERYVNWIDISAFPRFRKLWGRVDINESGNYIIEINSKSDFSKKGIFFSEKNWLGIKNHCISIGLLVIGIISLCFGLFLLIL